MWYDAVVVVGVLVCVVFCAKVKLMVHLVRFVCCCYVL
jgi:hypothetical protein